MSGAPVRLAGDEVTGVVSGRYNTADGWFKDSVWIARMTDLDRLLDGLSQTRVHHGQSRTERIVSPQVRLMHDVVGRDEQLLSLRAALTGTRELGLPKVLVLTGMAGVGKSCLARAYALAHRDDYQLMWWINAEDPAVLDAEFRVFSQVLAPDGGLVSIPCSVTGPKAREIRA